LHHIKLSTKFSILMINVEIDQYDYHAINTLTIHKKE